MTEVIFLVLTKHVNILDFVNVFTLHIKMCMKFLKLFSFKQAKNYSLY